MEIVIFSYVVHAGNSNIGTIGLEVYGLLFLRSC